jgi:gas vesicle protein
MKNRTLLILAAAGAAAAYLLTTKKGKAMTKDMMDCAGDWSNKAGGQVSDLTDYVTREASSIMQDARRKIAALVNEGMQTARDGKM